ncbi:MAG: cysteine desulfuration protein SufE [Tistrella sp.]|jgi:cysteine desulfuration protein SufE|uniref:Cysteine desulfuration protein SufE n=1 Tax=Tistrella mobilis TaxID=171437 RepID=A0A3B9IN30_9PROT|nr:SufE family protein [Tistrella sp.]MAD38817.1 cysteine desulfuration protein SufE [Tistrella sp.]MBA76783.1 cysteine desulfuration protein SufE [Tistrella sp.]HAE49282.1 cysteine desulfuration protein SufE [Tistrella mobilis]
MANAATEELIENFSLFDDWEERYAYLIDLGRKLPDLPEAERTPESKVEGCMSQVWLLSEVEPGNPPVIRYRADSDSQIVRGLIAVLMTAYSGETADRIIATDINDIFNRIGLDRHLSPNRRNGFYAMVQRISDTAAQAMKASS